MGRRRARGEGSVYQDKHGQWWAKIPIGPGQTRRTRCADRKEAEATLKRMLHERDGGLNLRESQQSVKTWLQHWLSTKKSEVAARTYEFYLFNCQYMVDIIGHIRLEALEPAHVRAMLASLRRSGLAPQSVVHVRSVLRNALNMALKDGAIQRNVAELVDPPRVKEYQAYVLSEEELAKLLEACKDERLGPAFEMAVLLGLRRSELLSLRWADVDWAAQTVTVSESKTQAGRRTLPLTHALIERLRAHWEQQQEERKILGTRWKEHGLIFASEVGTRMLGRNLVGRIFKRILRKAGLDSRIRLHDLRHTAITDWIAEGGADPKTAQVLAGHSDPQTTMKIYAKARSENLRKAIEGVEEKRRKRQA